MLRPQYFATLSLLALMAGCQPADYCREINRPLTDKELIHKALALEAATGRMEIDSSVKSIEEFFSRNPNCCKVFRGKNLSVQMFYQVGESYRKKGQSAAHFYEQNFEMDACGGGKNRYGMGIRKNEVACWAREEKLSQLSDNEVIDLAVTIASKRIRINQSKESIRQFVQDNSSCCEVKRNVQDPLHKELFNKAQIDIFYPNLLSAEEKKINHILVSLNECAEFAHMYGPHKESE